MPLSCNLTPERPYARLIKSDISGTKYEISFVLLTTFPSKKKQKWEKALLQTRPDFGTVKRGPSVSLKYALNVPHCLNQSFFYLISSLSPFLAPSVTQHL